MKNSSLGTKLLMAVVCLVVVAYFSLQGWNYFSDPLSTTYAYRYQVEESVTVTGWVARQERVLADSTSGLLRLTRSEGERVGKGGRVAVVYADQASLDRQNRLDSLRAQIDQLEYARSAASSNEAVMKLDNQITTSLLSFRQDVAADRLDNADSHMAELRSLILKRDYSYTGGEDLDARLESLRAECKTLEAQAASSARAVTAPVSGIYSAVVDGYESVLTPESLTALTPSTISQLQPTGEQSAVGKLITGDAWYYVASVPISAAETLTEGQTVTLRFAKGFDRDLTVRVASVGQEEDGRAVVVFTSDLFLPSLTLLRQQSADVITKTYTGIRVPSQAIRTERVYADRDTGELTEEAVTGVYCVMGRFARFKPVEILYTGDDGYVLALPTAADGSTVLRSGDEVIITAGGLYDGKVVREEA